MTPWQCAAAGAFFLSASIGAVCAATPDATADVEFPALPSHAEIDAVVSRLRETHEVPGIALAVIDDGRLAYLQTYGLRRVSPAEPLDADTVMYGASFTKFVFAAYVMQLVEDGVLDLDAPIGRYFDRPLPEIPEWADLAEDPRWKSLTLRHLLAHGSGFANFRFWPPDGEGFDADAPLRMYFQPGTRYAYSGEGYILAQRVVEHVLGTDPGPEMRQRIFAPLEMARTEMIWREDFRPNYAVGYSVDGEAQGHTMQDNTRAAGSMDTTIADFAKFIVGFLDDAVVSATSRQEMLSAQIPITSAHQFPTLREETDPRLRDIDFASGLGVVTFNGPQGPAFQKGGHNEVTDNTLLCVQRARRCVVLMSNTAKGDLVFPEIVDFILGDTGMPWAWEYSSRAE